MTSKQMAEVAGCSTTTISTSKIMSLVEEKIKKKMEPRIIQDRTKGGGH